MSNRNMRLRKNKKKVVLIGGVGNQLFIVWRALSYGSNFPDIVRLTSTQRKLTSLIGWTIQDDWLGIDKIVMDLGLTIRNLRFYELVPLFCMFILKKMNFLQFDNDLQATSKGIWDLGYFQKISCVDLKVLPQLIETVNALVPLKQESEFIIVHDRTGDFHERHQLPVEEVEKLLNSSIKQKRIIAAHSSARFKNFINLSTDELSDFNAIRVAETVIMTCSTFAFWGVMLSANPKVSVVYKKMDDLSCILAQAGRRVEYLE